MFKFLLLKANYDLSDRDLIERVRMDMSFKFFLGYSPEEIDIIDPSTLSKFRRERLKRFRDDDTVENLAINLLDIFLGKTVELAISKGILSRENKIIMDSTHSLALYGNETPKDHLIRISKDLRKSVYKVDDSMHDRMPKKPEPSCIIEDLIDYCKELLNLITPIKELMSYIKIQENINYLKEAIEDIKKELEYSKEQDAAVGHKSADSAFFGFKSHYTVTPEGLITAVIVSSGEKYDGDYLIELTEKSQKAGITVLEVIGDGAYSGQENLEYCEKNNIILTSKLNPSALHSTGKNADKFRYNKDANMYVCQNGHMAIRKSRTGKKSASQSLTFYFDVEKCKICPMSEGCYKPGAASKTYNVTIQKESISNQKKYMETESFKESYRERYKIEQKNAELKNNYNYEHASSLGIVGMTIQAAATLGIANLKRIFRLIAKKGDIVESP
jgi:hypothetical protein